MVRRFRPQNLASLSGSSFDSFQHELESRHRNDVACGVPPAVQLEPLGTGPPPVPQRSGNMPGWGVSFILPRGLKVDTKSSAWHGPRTRTAHEESDNALRSPHPKQPASSSKEYGDMGEPSPSTMTSDTLHTPQHPTAQTPLRRPSRSTRTIDREVWRMLLLNMYPVTYLILWLPGMLNRITEGMGHAIHALVILQSSTQFIGFANATVYIYQEHGKDIRRYWDSARSPKSARHEVLPGNVDNRRVAQPENRRWTSISV
ncbi:hypothetical protein J1614_010773 [Plenodomus biglobosus]|nr:hypothetical protein J1614_010773 [Plenodomus biglobosus]